MAARVTVSGASDTSRPILSTDGLGHAPPPVSGNPTRPRLHTVTHSARRVIGRPGVLSSVARREPPKPGHLVEVGVGRNDEVEAGLQCRGRMHRVATPNG